MAGRCGLPPAEAVALFHHRLVRILPFANSNGRWSRITANELLRRIDPDLFIDWVHEGALTSECHHRQRYIRALRAADGHDFAPLIAFVEQALG